MNAHHRRILGNLDCEPGWAREEARLRAARGERAPSPDDARLALPPAVERAVSAYATLLRAFAREGDRLWTPQAVDRERMAGVPGLPRPFLESGGTGNVPRCGRVLAWGETQAVEKARGAPLERTGQLPHSPGEVSSLADALWGISTPSAEAARTVNHRSFCLAVAQELDVALPGARRISSVGELEAHLARGGASASAEERWILKAPLSAAGRSRLRGAGRTLEASAARCVERLLELHGSLVFEPWMTRTADFGSCAILGDDELHLFTPHRLEVDAGGVFRGILVPAASERSTLLTQEETDLLEKTTKAVAARLSSAGYRGPFGIDCWRYRDVTGALRFHPLGEINARMSFGLVARGLAERLRETLGSRSTSMCLRLGRRDDLSERQARPGLHVIPLLLPSREDPSTAWLETISTR